MIALFLFCSGNWVNLKSLIWLTLLLSFKTIECNNVSTLQLSVLIIYLKTGSFFCIVIK